MESAHKLIAELGDQGIISKRRQKDFADGLERLFGDKTVIGQSSGEAQEPVTTKPMDLNDFLNLNKDKK